MQCAVIVHFIQQMHHNSALGKIYLDVTKFLSTDHCVVQFLLQNISIFGIGHSVKRQVDVNVYFFHLDSGTPIYCGSPVLDSRSKYRRGS